MKTKLFALFLLLTLVALESLSQENVQDPYTREIGFNTTFLFRGLFESTQTPFSFMYKTYKGENKAIRMGASIYIKITKSDVDTVRNAYTDESYASVSLSLGKEFQNHISEKWVWYYGFDFVPMVSFSSYKNYYYYYYPTGSYLSYSRKNFGVGVRPF